MSASIWTPSSEKQGFKLPDRMRFSSDGKFDTGRPEYVNVADVASYYRHDILATDRAYLPEKNQAEPLYPFQRVMMKTFTDAEFVWLQLMRGGSKTSTLARWALDYAMTVDKVGIIFTAPSFRQALLIYDECLRIIEAEDRNANTELRIALEMVGDPKRNALESILKFKNQSTIRALPMGDGTRIRGQRGGVLIVDEFYLITEEMYESHIKPFVTVKQGGRESKIIHATTSWYQDCYAYRRLMQIAAEVKAGNPRYAFLDFNLQNLREDGFPLSEAVWQDALKHGDKRQFVMTYFNIWPRLSARWYDQTTIDEAMSYSHGVRVEMKPEQGATYYAVIDLAASEKGDRTWVTVFKYDGGVSRAVWAYQARGMAPHDRAWLVHQVIDNFNPQFFIYDAQGAIGVDLRSDLSRDILIVKGEPVKVEPIVHHDAFNLTGRRILIPVNNTDDEVTRALIGPRDGTLIHGIAGMKELMHTKLRDLLREGKMLGPCTANERASEEDVMYVGSEIEALDTLRESFNQLANIGLRRTKVKDGGMGDIMHTVAGELLFETRQGAHDDGAMTLVYGTIGHLKLAGHGADSAERAKSLVSTMETTKPTDLRLAVPAEHVVKLRFGADKKRV